MGFPRRLLIIASSILLLLILAISLTAPLQVRAPPHKFLQISLAQAAKLEQSDRDLIKAKGRVNDTGFNRADILSGSSTVYRVPHTGTVYLDADVEPTATSTFGEEEGMIGETPTPPPELSASSIDEGSIGLFPTTTPTPAPAPQPPPASPQLPILALSYTGSGGPKHCRGDLLQKLSLPHPASTYKNGTCIDLPDMARCGVFFAGKEDGCEAQLFNMENCTNTTETYVNTVVFMPEERTVGALWRSMWVRCGVEAEEAQVLDPGLLSGLLKKPGGG